MNTGQQKEGVADRLQLDIGELGVQVGNAATTLVTSGAAVQLFGLFQSQFSRSEFPPLQDTLRQFGGWWWWSE